MLMGRWKFEFWSLEWEHGRYCNTSLILMGDIKKVWDGIKNPIRCNLI